VPAGPGSDDEPGAPGKAACLSAVRRVNEPASGRQAAALQKQQSSPPKGGRYVGKGRPPEGGHYMRETMPAGPGSNDEPGAPAKAASSRRTPKTASKPA